VSQHVPSAVGPMAPAAWAATQDASADVQTKKWYAVR